MREAKINVCANGLLLPQKFLLTLDTLWTLDDDVDRKLDSLVTATCELIG
jgi:hypothetical protein